MGTRKLPQVPWCVGGRGELGRGGSVPSFLLPPLPQAQRQSLPPPPAVHSQHTTAPHTFHFLHHGLGIMGVEKQLRFRLDYCSLLDPAKQPPIPPHQTTPPSVLVLPLLRCGQLDVCLGPQVAQVTHRQPQCDAHLARHDDEAHIPAEHGDNEEERSAALCVVG